MGCVFAHTNDAPCVCCLQLPTESANSLFDVIKNKIGIDKPITGYDGNQCLAIMKKRTAWISSMSGHPLFVQIKSKWEALSDVLQWVVLPDAADYLDEIENGVNQYCEVLTKYWGDRGLGIVDNYNNTAGTTSKAPCNNNHDGGKCGRGRAGRHDGGRCGRGRDGRHDGGRGGSALDPPEPLPPAGYLRQIYLFAKDQWTPDNTPHSVDHGFNARYKVAQMQFPRVEYLWKVYDHMFACHIIPQIKMYGNLISGSSWFVEAGNAAWKSCFKTFTSKGGGRSKSTLNRSIISQALKRMCMRTHHGVKQHSVHAREIIHRKCAKCGQLMKGHVCPNADSNTGT